MGYSCTVAAALSEGALYRLLTEDSKTSNGWDRNGSSYFAERGREHADGRVTGTVWRVEAPRCYKIGSYLVEANGRIARFPTTTMKERAEAQAKGDAQYKEQYG